MSEETEKTLDRLSAQSHLLNIGLPAAYDLVNDAMFVVGQDAKIMYCNKAATTLFGYAIAEMIGQPIEMLVPDDVKPHHEGLRAGFVAHPVPRQMAERSLVRGRHKNGENFEASVALSYVDTVLGILPVAQVRAANSAFVFRRTDPAA